MSPHLGVFSYEIRDLRAVLFEGLQCFLNESSGNIRQKEGLVTSEEQCANFPYRLLRSSWTGRGLSVLAFSEAR